jgi:hypothetical protein
MIPARILSSFPHFYTHRPHVVDASTDVPSSAPRPTYGLLPHPLPPVDRLGHPTVGAAVLEPTSYRDVVHTK